MERVTIRPLQATDAGAVERITRLSPEAAHWTFQGYQGLPGWVAEDGREVVGFLFARIAADEMEILNLAVEPAAREQGVGGALLSAALAYGGKAGVTRVFLEVRESNRRARQFYERRGFSVTGRRPRYYHRPPEDALVMGHALPVSP